MANICDTTYRFSGDTEAVQNLHHTLLKLEKIEGCNIPLCRLANEYGIDYEKEKISVRGEAYFYDYDDVGNILTIDTSTAWTGCHDLFYAINEKLGEGIAISYREVECGCCIFAIHNEGDFGFYEQCLVSASGGPFEEGMEDSFNSIEDAIEYWCERMKFDRGGRSEKEMLELIDGYDYGSDDVYFYINEFEFE